MLYFKGKDEGVTGLTDGCAYFVGSVNTTRTTFQLFASRENALQERNALELGPGSPDPSTSMDFSTFAAGSAARAA